MKKREVRSDNWYFGDKGTSMMNIECVVMMMMLDGGDDNDDDGDGTDI